MKADQRADLPTLFSNARINKAVVIFLLPDDFTLYYSAELDKLRFMPYTTSAPVSLTAADVVGIPNIRVGDYWLFHVPRLSSRCKRYYKTIPSAIADAVKLWDKHRA